MKKYVATPGAEVIGSAMNNWFVSVNRDEVYPIVQKMLNDYGVDILEDDEWYPHQLSLDIFKLLHVQKPDSNNLFMLGTAYVETATFPHEVFQVRSVLMTLQTTYHLNIRNIPQSEGYQASQLADGHIQIKDLNPFPHDTVYGFIYGITKRFNRSAKDAIVVRTFVDPSDPDADGAIYDIVLDDG